MKKGLKASSLRKLLTVVLVLLIAIIAGGFYYGLEQVRTFAVEVNHTAADATASGNSIQELQKLKQALAERETLVSKANQVFATTGNYQSQALTDVQKYAASAGITISNTDFSDDGATAGASPSFIITLQSPLEYAKLLQFLDSVEGNLPKMQVISIDLNRATAEPATRVVTGDIKITIATR